MHFVCGFQAGRIKEGCTFFLIIAYNWLTNLLTYILTSCRLRDILITGSKEMIIMPSVISAIQNTVPITHFNRGLAGKIFEEVKATGAKVVMKNNAAECVLLSPDEYVRLMDEVNDARLLAIATERMANFDPSALIPEEKVWERLGVTQEELDSIGEVEIE
jgi:PHD/YefM family antitoxin component YafN of YafNO toxin-antitoxin module